MYRECMYCIHEKTTDGVLSFSKLNLCEGGSCSTVIFNSNIQLSYFSFSCFISVCPFVTLVKAMYAENSHIVLSSFDRRINVLLYSQFNSRVVSIV